MKSLSVFAAVILVAICITVVLTIIYVGVSWAIILFPPMVWMLPLAVVILFVSCMIVGVAKGIPGKT